MVNPAPCSRERGDSGLRGLVEQPVVDPEVRVVRVLVQHGLRVAHPKGSQQVLGGLGGGHREGLRGDGVALVDACGRSDVASRPIGAPPQVVHRLAVPGVEQQL